MNVAVVGTGYVGLVSGVCLAAKGHHVTCVDVSRDVVQQLNAGVPHIHESDLEGLLKEALATGHFRATVDLDAALDASDLAMIAVGTPSTDGAIDLTALRTAAAAIGRYMARTARPLTVIVKSTVVPGTTDTVVRKEIEKASGMTHPGFGLGMNPEFLREGQAVVDFMCPDRIVLGHEDAVALAQLEELYSPWACDKVAVNTRTAELIKYANNALLATQISAVNEIANYATAVGGIDVMDVIRGVALDKRWSPIIEGTRLSPSILTYLIPGCGFGGSCFPKDLQALRAHGAGFGLDMKMIDSVLAVNQEQPDQVVAALERHLGTLQGQRCLVLGLAFKPGTDDVRESPSLRIVDALLRRGAGVIAHDPIATDRFKKAFGDRASAVRFVDDWRGHVAGADGIIVATTWPEYEELPALHGAVKTLFDARRMFTPSDFPSSAYLAVGLSAPAGQAGS